eukprot:3450308-Pleurochrysis_carterae.AAC.1
MHPNEAPEESGGSGPSQPPERHKPEDRDEVASGLESDQTKATILSMRRKNPTAVPPPRGNWSLPSRNFD